VERADDGEPDGQRRPRLQLDRQRRDLDTGRGRPVQPELPTPTGTFFITELLEQSNPRGLYGPYAFGLSAYSNVLYSFGGGPGQIGIHGTNEPSLLGTSASHGCIRVANAVIARLARLLPLGTPVASGR
jgi:lipoprotein-anchoring transpeptidase ErfK/SrfK